MSKQYPYLENKKRVKNIICETCSKPKDGYKLEWQVSWFRGDDEYEKICDDCLKKREAEERAREKAYLKKMKPIWKAEAERKERFWDDMKRRLEDKYQVNYLTEYQWRINSCIDIYPQSRRYHDIQKNERGDYQDVHKFLAERRKHWGMSNGKKCKTCNQPKSLDSFYKNKNSPDGLFAACKICVIKRSSEWQSKNTWGKQKGGDI